MSINISTIDYRQVLDYTIEPIIIHTNLTILYINKAAEEFFKGAKEDIIGASPLDIFQETSKPSIEKRILSAYENPAKVIEETIYKMDGTTVDVELYCHPVKIEDKKAIQTYVRDITSRREAEKRQDEMTREVNELSSTLVPVLDGIAVLPLVGAIDEVRAKQLLDNVPARVRRQNIECLIIDFSGIYNLDTVVTDYLFKINSVMSVLGVRTIITGLRPELALIALQLDINWASTPTMASVKDALQSLGLNMNRKSL